MSEKTLMLGNASVARGLFEAGCSFVSSYPGTPSTEITEEVSDYSEVYAEWAPNEKVALEAAFGASLAGARAFAGMKHVGLNVAADPLFTASYTGVNGGLVIAVADDPGMHSSQNEQDSRHYAIAAKLPMLEPSDSCDCIEFTKKAFDISERFDTPVLLRMSTRVAHSQSLVSLGERILPQAHAYEKNIAKYVMMPANAKKRHVTVEERTLALAEFAESDSVNSVISGSDEIGIVAAGTGYLYAREALGDGASYLKLGMVNPLPLKKIAEFAKTVKRLVIIEELDPVIETAVRNAGIPCEGKELFSLLGEYTAEGIRRALLGIFTDAIAATEVPARPPVLCPGCPHRGTFYVLKKLGLYVSGDIGCYTLGAAAPLSSVDLTLCMGASVSSLHGFLKAGGDPKKSVAVIGDSTFVHSGITGLVNIVYNQSPATVLILDNSTTGMTGHQQNPCTGLTLKNTPAPVLDLEALCTAVGVKRVCTADPGDIAELERVIKEELEADEPSVVIVKRPCALLKTVKHGAPLAVKDCRKCKACMKIACPAISFTKEKGAIIDASLCVGCGLCQQLCPFGAIVKEEK